MRESTSSVKLGPVPGFSGGSNYSVALGLGFDWDTNLPNTLRNKAKGETQETQFCNIIYVSITNLTTFQ